MSKIIECECGARYTAADASAIKRHELTQKHISGLQSREGSDVTDTTPQGEAFDDLDDLVDSNDEQPEPEPVKPKRARKPKTPTTFAELDKTDAAKSFTEDERVSISNSVTKVKSALDDSVSPKEVAEAFVAAAGPGVNEAIRPDLQTYIEGVVTVLRVDAARQKPLDKPAPKAKVEKAKPEPKTKPAAKAKPIPASASGHKVCRVCSQDKALEEYRKKSSRPDGRDTICIDCSKAWLVAHRAKQAAAK